MKGMVITPKTGSLCLTVETPIVIVGQVVFIPYLMIPCVDMPGDAVHSYDSRGPPVFDAQTLLAVIAQAA